MNGRMAYIIMCVEAFLITKYPDRDWTFLAERMWEATNHDWAYWPDMFNYLLPEVFCLFEAYDYDELNKYMTEKDFYDVKALFAGITEGVEDDPEDILNCLIMKPFEMGMVYEGTGIGDGHESFEIIDETESILINNGVELPDYRKVLFSSFDQRRGWGDDFDGRFLSVILNK